MRKKGVELLEEMSRVFKVIRFALQIVVPFAVVFAGVSVSAQTITKTFGSGTNQFSMDFVEIGNPGNAADPTSIPTSTGAVNYIYNLGKYEISRDQINKANAAGNLGITLQDMTSYGGNGANRPATGISWNEAARFVNYLNTSQGYQVAYKFTTNTANANIMLWGAGEYTSQNNQYRHKNAYYFLPSRDEWFKGGYFDPNKAGGAGYWDFATGGDTAATSVSGGTSGSVYSQPIPQGPADITSAGGLSPYGTMGQGGNVMEWIEDGGTGVNDSPTASREFRGGAWMNGFASMKSTDRGAMAPGTEVYQLGFRVASVPEPSALSLLAVGLGVVLRRRRRTV
jgi:formylglycine-generating enzyme required for sulfatase activity